MVAETIKNSLKENGDMLKKEFGNSTDLMEREMELGELRVAASLFYIEGIVRSEAIEEAIIMPSNSIKEKKEEIEGTVVDFLRVNVINTLNVSSIGDWNSIVTGLLNGNTVLFVSGESLCLLIDTVQWPERDAPEPKAQRTPIGPDIGFNEYITNNLALIRKTIKDPCIRVEDNPNANVRTSIKLVYLEGKVDKEILHNVKSKLQQMNIQNVLDVNYLEEALIDETRSTFPLMLSSDRPDVVSAEILSGKIGILVDGTPFIATVPSVFVQFFQSPDDYYSINRSTQNRRLLRMLFFLLSLLLPGVYIAFTLYHPGLIPTSLLIGLLAQREIVPFPTIVEIVIFFWLLVIITEGSLRLPSGVVLTVTIFSSIILGQQAVEAKLVQPTTLVVLGASYVMSSVVPLYSITTLYRRLTFRFIILGSLLGLYGIMIGLIVLILHLSSLRSFGVPYLSPMAPFQLKDQKDAIFRVPIQYIVNNKKTITKEDNMKKQ